MFERTVVIKALQGGHIAPLADALRPSKQYHITDIPALAPLPARALSRGHPMQQLGANGFDPDVLNDYVSRIRDADDEILSHKNECAQACKDPRARIKGVMAEAKEAGHNMAALRTIIAKDRADRQIDRKIAALEAADRDDFEEMQRALGGLADTPLGAAALRRAKPRGEEVLNTLGDGPPPKRADEESLEQVGRGS